MSYGRPRREDERMTAGDCWTGSAGDWTGGVHLHLLGFGCTPEPRGSTEDGEHDWSKPQKSNVQSGWETEDVKSDRQLFTRTRHSAQAFECSRSSRLGEAAIDKELCVTRPSPGLRRAADQPTIQLTVSYGANNAALPAAYKLPNITKRTRRLLATVCSPLRSSDRSVTWTDRHYEKARPYPRTSRTATATTTHTPQ
ncbi:hypothetical protein G7K_4084-t1 [Saitoella complicata NRRL Y-17804]|uniref:Uncharacterized protein n=1 Tax=Saitoella complicata (strain BCRC 22490 / CBS 7301 / JCM 7358 / NBRC 10748 / NRRL Y-17804) TaxID=698492 RepID=A0A0E9NJH1_SAICN|nr:hypothetical protein G7K_4084-t1 [Saitoella complicata NRRL Y-17804]